MSYSKVNLIIQLPELIKRINRRIGPDRINKISSGAFGKDMLTIYFELKQANDRLYSVTITEMGEVYNPFMPAELLSCVFHWLLNIDKKRQNDRVNVFKQELYEKVWHPSNHNFECVE